MTNIKIQAEWNLREQKVTFGSETDINFPVLASVKDYSSNAVMWSVSYEKIPKNVNFWIIPPRFSLNTDVFSGIKLCLYNKETGRQIYEKPFFYKYVDIKHSDLSDTIPYYSNYMEYFYDKKFNKFFKENYKNCVDAGANVGVFTKFLIENNMTQKIVSVECDPIALKDLNKNFKFNSNVKIVNKALHYNNDRLKFYHCPTNPVVSSKLDHTKVSHHGSAIRVNQEILVDTVTVRELVNELGVIDLLKVDIEGSEYDIFENMDDDLFKYINNIFIECHFFESDYREKYKKLIHKLNKNGYSVEENAINQTDNAGGSDMIFAMPAFYS